MSDPNALPPDEEPKDKVAKQKPAKKKPRARTILITITCKDVNDPKALLAAVVQALKEKQNVTPKFVLKDVPNTVSPNEQIEAKVTKEVGEHLEAKTAPSAQTQKADESSPVPEKPAEPKKAEEVARERIKRSLLSLAVNGVRVIVKAVLEWGKGELKKLGGGGG